VRLRHLPSHRNYTVVFSHLQADYFDKSPPEINAGAREGQFAQVEKLIETTLSPLSDSERRQERVLMMGDLNVPLFHQPAGEWAGRFATPGTYWTDNFYDAWAATNSPTDPGISNHIDAERYDYILASPKRYESGGIEGPICIQHMTIPKDFVDLESDHNMVTADLNIGNYFCHPQIAHKVALKKMAALPAVAAFPVKQFPVIELNCAPRVLSAVFPKLVSAMPEEALLLNVFPETWTCWIPAWIPFAE
jgi:hypothetical protein